MHANNKVIITCAVTGSVHTPSLSESLPYRPDDIAEQAIAAAQAGAAILNLHARDPQDGRPTGDPEVFVQFLPRIHERTDAVLNITTGGAIHMSPDERLAAALRFRPEMCSLNMGSINFAFHLMGGKVKQWRFPWNMTNRARAPTASWRRPATWRCSCAGTGRRAIVAGL